MLFKKNNLKAEPIVYQEVILVVGLPGAGKTYWALNHSKKFLKKFYFIIGVASILDKMKVCIKNC